MAQTTAAMEAVLAELNPQQREAAVHGRGPLLIVAGAGTGKTTTLAHRVAHLIASGGDPGRILLLTFTRRSAAEMLRRVEAIVREVDRASSASQQPASGGEMVSGGRKSPDAHASVASESPIETNSGLTPTARQTGLTPTARQTGLTPTARQTGLTPTARQSSAARRGGVSIARKVWGGTFHAVATRLLRQYGKKIGLPPAFSILDRSDSEDLMHVVRAELGMGDNDPKKEGSRKRRDATRFPLKGTCVNIYSRAVNTQQPLKKVLQNDFPWCEEHEAKLKQLFSAYVDRKEESGVLDYDDLLLFWRAMMQNAEVGAKIREKFDCVLVDEYQDTNRVQADILAGLAPDGEGLTVVGDDAQSIYSFRAADVRNILDFPNEYPGTTIIKLEQNYRSTQPILNATNAVIAAAKKRHKKDLWSSRQQGDMPQLVLCEDEDEQTEYLIDRILEHRENGLKLQQQAILFRASHHCIGLEVELARRNIPFHKYGGLKFVETAHVKDTLAFLRLAENPKDIVSGMRILTLIPGIGQVKARQLLLLLSEHNADFTCWKDVSPPKAAATDWPLFVSLMRTLKGAVNDQLHRVRRFYAPLLERKYDNARERIVDLEQLEVIATRFKDRQQFLSEMSLDPPSSTQELAGDPLLDDDFLVLSTIHSAKGLEWDAVTVIHAADGNIPSDLATGDSAQIEEERRLFYVACTRAKDHLTITVPQRFYFHGRWQSDMHSYAQPSRFLTPDARQHIEQVTAFPADPDEQGEEPLSSTSVRNDIKGMWN